MVDLFNFLNEGWYDVQNPAVYLDLMFNLDLLIPEGIEIQDSVMIFLGLMRSKDEGILLPLQRARLHKPL